MNVVTLQYLRLPEEKEYIDFILNECNISVIMIAQELFNYTRNLPLFFNWDYDRVIDKYIYIIESLLLRPQTQVDELENIIIMLFQEFDTKFHQIDKTLLKHPLISQVDPNLVVLRFINWHTWNVQKFILRPEITSETIVKILENKNFNLVVNLSKEIFKSPHITENLARNFFIKICDNSNQGRKKLELSRERELNLFNAIRPHLTLELIQSEVEKLKPNIFWRKTLEGYLQNPNMKYDPRIKKS